MKTYLFQGTITLLSSLSHIGETHGINSLFHREKFVTADGNIKDIPTVTGNGLRGLLRDRGMMHLIKMLGYGDGKGLGLESFYFLFSGGSLSSKGGSGKIDVDTARRWRELIPLVSLFGGAMGNQIMPGKMSVGKGIPICSELSHVVPEQFLNGHTTSVRTMMQFEPYTRRDDAKNDNMRYLIDNKVLNLLDDKQRGTNRFDAIEETGQKQQMRYFVETMAAGSKLFWEITLQDVTDVEFDAFAVTLAQFGKYPFIGGKSNVGHGKVRIEFENWIELNTNMERHGKEVGLPLGQHYLQHIEKNADEIRRLIGEL